MHVPHTVIVIWIAISSNCQCQTLLPTSLFNGASREKQNQTMHGYIQEFFLKCMLIWPPCSQLLSDNQMSHNLHVCMHAMVKIARESYTLLYLTLFLYSIKLCILTCKGGIFNLLNWRQPIWYTRCRCQPVHKLLRICPKWYSSTCSDAMKNAHSLYIILNYMSHTVDLWLSGPCLSGTSIIRN